MGTLAHQEKTPLQQKKYITHFDCELLFLIVIFSVHFSTHCDILYHGLNLSLLWIKISDVFEDHLAMWYAFIEAFEQQLPQRTTSLDVYNKSNSFIPKAAITSWLVSFIYFSEPFSHLALVPSQVSKPE